MKLTKKKLIGKGLKMNSKDLGSIPTHGSQQSICQSTSRKSNSGVSIAIRNTMSSLEKGKHLIEKVKSSGFTIKVANTLEEREAVFQLAYQVYLEKGYVKENELERLVNSYDADADTTILIVKDVNNNIVGSVTLVFGGQSKLPAEKIYRQELNRLKSENEKMVEISRLVIDPNFRNSKEILVLLFNYLYIYSYYVKGYTCLVIEVNPRHIAYYNALLNFKPIGSEKPCPNVESAPAILMYLPLKHGQGEVLRLSKITEAEKNNRTLYQYFIKPEQESLVAYFLEKQATPMTVEEKIYFGFSESGLNYEICV